MLEIVIDPSLIDVPIDFEREFPGASRSATQVAANLVRTATELLAEIERPPRQAADLSVSGFQVLAILDGAGEPLSPQTIAEHLLLTSASMTSLLDTLQRRGLIERHPHPADRRKILIHLTDAAQRTVDEQLPAVHAAITEAMADLSGTEREHLLQSLTKIRAGLTRVNTQAVPTPKPRRRRRT
jgi:DNA-binding MarR family transcriptional regulator